MSRCNKLESKARRSSHNLSFDDLCYLAECYGFELVRQRGTSHRIYRLNTYSTLMNFQSKNGKAKAYQVEQLLSAINEIKSMQGM